jgi:hypothetical protein
LAKTIASWRFLLDMLGMVTKEKAAMAAAAYCIANRISR